MTEDTEATEAPEKRIFGEARGRYTLIDAQKAFHLDFPGNSTVEENFAAISFIRNQVLKAINVLKEQEEKKEQEENKEEKEECKEDLQESTEKEES